MDDLATVRCLSDADFETSVVDRYFEDYVPGRDYQYGFITVSETEIVGFARRYDPQTIHVDPEAAASGPFGGLIASGWHTAALCMKFIAGHYLSHVASLASPGVDELRWPNPVRPGDLLRASFRVDASRVSVSKPDRGIVHTTAELWNQTDDCVLSAKLMNLVGLRESRGAGLWAGTNE